MSGKVITWNGVSSETVDGIIVGQVTRDPIGAPRTKFVEVAGKEGAWVFPQKRGMRKIAAEVSVSTLRGEPLREAMEALSDWLDVENEAQLILSDDPGIYHMASVQTVSEVPEWNGLARMLITWACQPYSYDESLTDEDWTSGVNTNHSWNPGLKVPVYPVIEITPTNGTLIGFTLEANGNTLTYAGNLINSGSTVTINALVPVVVSGPNDDVNLTGSWDPADSLVEYVTGSFPILLPAVMNNIRFVRTEGTATSFSIEVTYRKRYRR